MTAVELLPVHHIIDESFLADRGLTNYWGYSSIGYLAPHSLYAATGDQVREFKGMVKALHRAGIEVILDVVYNHTAEGNHLGPMLSFRGVDNESYYRLVPETPRFYMDYTGTGNTLNPVHPSVLRLIMDSLRYFVTECHVDGFRFDLASALAREFYDVDRLSAFFDVIHQDPVLSQVKLIAEPWDVGPGGYQVGNFPILWSEWNGIYRDTMRDFWRGEATVAEFASRFGGSADLYESDGRKPFASVNFITAHDGFTLRDLVSYDQKHNEANGEGEPRRHRRQPLLELRRRGADRRSRGQRAARSPAAQLPRDAAALAGRADGARRRRVGEVAGRQQQRVVPGQRGLVVRLGRVRRGAARVHEAADRAAARSIRCSAGRGSSTAPASTCRTCGGCGPDGRRMTRRDWDNTGSRAIGAFLNGEELGTQNAHGEELRDDSFLLLFNGHFEEITFRLPARRFATRWEVVLRDRASARPSASSRAATSRRVALARAARRV